jgi:hypothetical protein
MVTNFNQPKEAKVAANKWKFVVVLEDGTLQGSDSKEDVIALLQEAPAVAALEFSDDGIFQLAYSEENEELSREEIEAL